MGILQISLRIISLVIFFNSESFMNELYTSILSVGRSPERAEPLLEMANELYVSGFDVTLDEIETSVAIYDAVSDIVPHAENYIITCAETMLNRLGVNIQFDTIYNNVLAVNEILQTLTNGFEKVVDYESLQAIMGSGEHRELLLADVIGYMNDKSPSDYYELFTNVEPRLIDAINDKLNSLQANDENSDVMDVDLALRVSKFIERYPNDINALALKDNGYLSNKDLLIENITVSSDNSLELWPIAIASVVISEVTNVTDISKYISEVANILITEEHPQYIRITKDAYIIVNDIFSEVDNGVIEDE